MYGTDNAIYRLGPDLVVRLPRLPRSVVSLDAEQRWLPRLAPSLPLAVPIPLARGAPADGYPFPWAVYRWLDGRSLADKPVADPPDTAVRLARFLVALQGISTAGAPRSPRADPVSERDDDDVRRTIRMLAAEGSLDPVAATGVWDAALVAPSWDRTPVWTHGDLLPGNPPGGTRSIGRGHRLRPARPR